MPGQFTADRKRLQTDIDALAQFGKSGPTAITRLAFTEADNEAHQHVERLMREAGLENLQDDQKVSYELERDSEGKISVGKLSSL